MINAGCVYRIVNAPGRYSQMGQAERDRRRIERLERDRKHMEEKKALDGSALPHFGSREEGSDHPAAPVEWGTLTSLVEYSFAAF